MPTTLYHITVTTVLLIPDEPSADFNDLGRKLLVGFLLAVVVAVGYALLKLRWRDQNPAAKFISISASEDLADSRKASGD